MATLAVGNGTIGVKGGNLLQNCFHPLFGWVWSDGCSVFLLESSDDGTITDSSSSRKLGEYRDVISVSWGSHTNGDTVGCFLAVHEKTAVTIWEVSGRGMQTEFKLKRKIADLKEVNGIIWHPKQPIICLLSTSGIHVYSILPDWSLCLTDESYRTGCWSLDGTSLVLAAERSIELFEWGDIVKDRDGWKRRSITLSRFHGKVKCIVGLPSQRVIVTTDLPLAEIINQSNQDTFEPFIINHNTSSNRPLITEVTEGLSNVIPKIKADESDTTVRKVDIPGGETSSSLLDQLKKEIASQEKGPIDLTSMVSVFSEERTDSREQRKVQEISEEQSGKAGSGLEGKGVTCSNEKSETNGLGVKQEQRTSTDGDGASKVVGASDLFMGEDFVKRGDLGASKTAGWNLCSSDDHPSRSSAVPVFKQCEKVALEDSAYVHLVDLSASEDTAVLDSCKVPEMISPELVSFQKLSNVLLIGSRSNQPIQMYRVQGSTIKKLDKQLSLNDQERPVGISTGVGNDLVTILVSQPVTSSMQGVFPTSSSSKQVHLSFKQMRTGND